MRGHPNHSITPMNTRNFSLCVLGCGSYAADFCGSLQDAASEIDLFFASRDEARSRAYSLRFGGRGHFGSYLEAAKASSIDALYVCTPHYLHREHAEVGLRFGKHLLVEKPLAQNPAEAAAIVEAARAAGVTLMVAENIRYFPQIRECHRLVSEGAVGAVRLVQFQEEYPFEPGGWRGRESLNGGGVLIDGGIHKVHFMRYLLGEPQTVFAAQLPKAMDGQEGEDGIVATLAWRSGAVGVINHSWTAGQPRRPFVEVSGTRGRIEFEIGSGRVTLDQGAGVRTLPVPPGHRGIPAMLQEFRDSVRERREPETSGEEGLRDVSLVFAAYESARLGASVTLEDAAQQ